MHKKYLLIWALLIGIFSTEVAAEPFKPFDSERISHFSSWHSAKAVNFIPSIDNQVISVYVDSFERSGDYKKLYFNRMFGQTAGSEDCFKPLQPSVVGYFGIQNESEFQFYNLQQDTITIKYASDTGETWTVHELNDSIHIQAEVKKIVTEEILPGLSDSVKYLQLNAYDREGNIADHDINGEHIKISKNHGFVRFFGIKRFPDELFFIDLEGITNPDHGLQNIDRFGIFDFQEGDIIHIHTDKNQSLRRGDIIDARKGWKILERNDYNDSVVYKIHRKLDSEEAYFDSDDQLVFNTTCFEDTFNLKIPGKWAGSLAIDKLSFESSFHTHGKLKDFEALTYLYYSEEYDRAAKNVSDFFRYNNNYCLQKVVGTGYFSENYYEGLGGPYYRSQLHGGRYNRTLRYFKKGDEEQGSAFEFSCLDEKMPEDSNETHEKSYSNAFIGPNPVIDKAIFQLIPKKTKSIHLVDITGRKVFKEKTNGRKLIELNLSFLEPGTYSYYVYDNNNEISFKGKIIKSENP